MIDMKISLYPKRKVLLVRGGVMIITARREIGPQSPLRSVSKEPRLR